MPEPRRWTHTKDNMDLTWVGRACNVYFRWTRWLRPFSFWRGYVFAPYGGSKLDRRGVTSRRLVWCRLRGHPDGPIYYSSGLEPDGRCADCLEVIA